MGMPVGIIFFGLCEVERPAHYGWYHSLDRILNYLSGESSLRSSMHLFLFSSWLPTQGDLAASSSHLSFPADELYLKL